MMRKVSLRNLFKRKDCYGWAWHVKGRQYVWYNINDLGLVHDIEECTYPETILKKIEIEKGKYLYVLRNNYGFKANDEPTATLTTIKALLKDCHNLRMTKHEQMLSNRWFGI